MTSSPSYIALHRSGELAARAKRAMASLECCKLCPRECGIDRLAGAAGFCGVAGKARVASYTLHFGEEEPLVGTRGSGTIFFSGCNLGCVFCQNYDISHVPDAGEEVSAPQLAGIMLELAASGAANINLVTPSHVVPQILTALDLAAARGLALPLVYNSGGYDAPATLALLDGVVDIYMPDVKFAGPDAALRLCLTGDYPAACRRAVKIMHDQVGDLVLNEKGLARRGLLVRHLVLPHGLAGTREWMTYLADEISADTYVNVMDQYRPCGRAFEHPDITRGISPEEYRQALAEARRAGITRLDQRHKTRAAWLLRAFLEGKG